MPDLNNTEPCTSLNSYRNATAEANLRAKRVLREGPQVATLCNVLSEAQQQNTADRTRAVLQKRRRCVAELYQLFDVGQ